MYVSSIAQNSQTQTFHGNRVAKALTLVNPDSKVSKGLTRLDAAVAQAYVRSIPYRLGVTVNEVNTLKQFDGDSFLFASFDFLGHKLGFSRNIRPQMQIVDDIVGGVHMAYLPLYNRVLCSKSTISKMPRENVFGLIRHEYQHYIQNVNALRHETFGEEVVNIMCQNNIKMQKDVINKLFEQFSIDQIKEIYKESPESLDYIMYIKKTMDSGDEKLVDDLFEIIGQDYRQSLTEYRMNVIKELGVIKKDSAMTPKIKRDFEELQNVGYYNPNGTIDFSRYFASGIEDEAIKAQTAAELGFEPGICGFKQIKDATLNDLVQKNKAELDIVNK